NRSLFLLHYVAPVMVFVDWLAFGPHGVTRYREAIAWLAYPLGYVVVMVARAVLLPESPELYPYGFMDPTVQGYGGVGAWILGLAAGVTVLAVLVITIDRVLGRGVLARGVQGG